MPESIGFVVVAAYDSQGRTAIKNSSPNKKYSFIGPHLFGGTVEKLSSYCLEEAASAIVSEALEVEVLELEPIAIVQNTFVCGEQKKLHHGIAFAAFVGAPIASRDDIFWTKERHAGLIFQNTAILDCVLEYIRDRHIAVPVAEALSGNRGLIKRFIHHYVVRPIIHSGSSKKIRQRIRSNIVTCESYLDISAGDDDFVIEISEEYDPSIIVANDISWPAMKSVRAKSSNHNYNVIFTNHNLCDLPFNIQFDVVLWKNTLHHVASLEEMIHALDCVGSIAKKLIIVDIEDPRRSRRGRLWNRYYEHFYGDADEDHHFFFTRSSFRNLIDAAFAGKKKDFETIRTLKGNYLLAAIDLTSNP